MKALVYHGPRKLTMEDRQMPELRTNEVILKVEAVGICGSELEGYLGHSSIRIPPLVMGHEFSGIVVEKSKEFAKKTNKANIGDKVIVNPLISCGSCDLCKMGKPNLCRDRQIIGIHRPGAFAEYVSVPQQNIYPIPNEMSSPLASLAEPLAVAIHGVKLGIQSDDNLLIFGAGPIGILALQVAKYMGINQVLVVDKQAERLKYAELLGAQIATPQQLDEQFARTFSAQGVDTIIDCVGVQGTLDQSMKFINPGGRIVMIGLGNDHA